MQGWGDPKGGGSAQAAASGLRCGEAGGDVLQGCHPGQLGPGFSRGGLPSGMTAEGRRQVLEETRGWFSASASPALRWTPPYS